MTHAADYATQAAEVTKAFVADFSLPSGLFAHSRKDRHSDFMWGNGVTFSALAAAARHDPKQYRPRTGKFFIAMDAYWDKLAPVPGYEPAPTKGHGHDKYYDDNAWMVLTFLEAYDLTKDKKYLDRAEGALKFALSAEDDTLGGGQWWHEPERKSKHTCVTAPTAVGCLRLAEYLPKKEAAEMVATAKRLVDWTTDKLLREDGRYADNIKTDGTVDPHAWTYNSALMIRAYLGLYRRTGEATYLDHAKRIGEACEAFVDPATGAYHDGFKFTHLLVEADCELYRATGDKSLLRRAQANADHAYADWKAKPHNEIIENSSVARLLWLVADATGENRGPTP